MRTLCRVVRPELFTLMLPNISARTPGKHGEDIDAVYWDGMRA